MNYTTIEQSKKLLELGLNPETADMWYINGEGNPYIGDWNENSHDSDDLPTWSVGRLLELMSKLQSKEDEITGAKVVVNPFIGINSCCYINESNRIEFKKDGKTPIDAAYNMIVWLLENDYIKTEKK